METHEVISTIESDNKNNSEKINILSINNTEEGNNQDSSDKKLEKAFDKIEFFLDKKLFSPDFINSNKILDKILANLDILITQVKDVLLKVD